MPFVPLGVVPEAASSFLLPMIAGYQRAAELLLLGQPFSAEKALAAGFVTEIVPEEKLLEHARAAAIAVAALPPASVRLTKQLMKRQLGAAIAAQMARGRPHLRRAPAVGRGEGGDDRLLREAQARLLQVLTGANVAMEIKHRFVETNGLRMHLAEAGQGPLVMLCHGWPESWYSWRHQLIALAEAGYHAVAPDQRGYGQTDKPEAIDQYTLMHLVGDMVGLLDALGEPTAVIAGHDWGAPVAWHARAAASGPLPRGDRAQRALPAARFDASHDRDAADRRTRCSTSSIFSSRALPRPNSSAIPGRPSCRSSMADQGDASRGVRVAGASDVGMVPRAGGFLRGARCPRRCRSGSPRRTSISTPASSSAAASAGGLNWYRNIDRNWEIFAPWAGREGHRAGALHGGRPRPGCRLPRHGQAAAGAQARSFHSCGRRSSCPAAAIGPSRNGPPKSMRR